MTVDERMKLEGGPDRYETARRLETDRRAGMIDAQPGITAEALGLISANSPGTLRLQARGYRARWVSDELRWWPSRRRCAELARSATGEHREKLRRGMLL